MTLLRMDNVLLVVDDIEAAIALFVDLGIRLAEPQGRAAAAEPPA